MIRKALRCFCDSRNVLSSVEGHYLFCNLLETQVLSHGREHSLYSCRRGGAACIRTRSYLTHVVATIGWNHPLSSPNWISRRRQWHPTPVLLPGKSHGWRSLVGCSPWGRYELDTTERLHFHFSLLCIGEGNGNPLQCSCLENPRDKGAWWAAVYGVAQSQTWLKQLSSSSSNWISWRNPHNLMSEMFYTG